MLFPTNRLKVGTKTIFLYIFVQEIQWINHIKLRNLIHTYIIELTYNMFCLNFNVLIAVVVLLLKLNIMASITAYRILYFNCMQSKRNTKQAPF